MRHPCSCEHSGCARRPPGALRHSCCIIVKFFAKDGGDEERSSTSTVSQRAFICLLQMAGPAWPGPKSPQWQLKAQRTAPLARQRHQFPLASTRADRILDLVARGALASAPRRVDQGNVRPHRARAPSPGMAAFKAYLKELRSKPAEPDYEPQVDERDEKEERELRCVGTAFLLHGTAVDSSWRASGCLFVTGWLSLVATPQGDVVC